MSLYLCIDGGGTKTTAVIARLPASNQAGDITVLARGEAGPSNLTFGVDGCVQATIQAVRRALGVAESTELPAFRKVWAGYAGCARPSDYATLLPALAPLFPGADLRLSSDGELLTSPLISSPLADWCVTLICGTGSLALLWQAEGHGKNGRSVKQVGRSGGWGSVLGDEGSGWSLGREGIKSVLTCTTNGLPLLPWHRQIMDYFAVEDANLLLARATTLSGSSGSAEAERKKRIASCAKYVVEASSAQDPAARRVVDKVVGEVVETLRPLIERQSGQMARTMLVVTGGLGRANHFWGLVESRMGEMGWKWLEVVHITDPAEDGVKILYS